MLFHGLPAPSRCSSSVRILGRPGSPRLRRWVKAIKKDHLAFFPAAKDLHLIFPKEARVVADAAKLSSSLAAGANLGRVSPQTVGTNVGANPLRVDIRW